MRPKGTKKEGMKYLSEQQLKSFITQVEKSNNLRDEVMMKLALWLGLRVQEICNIKLEHINPDSREIFIKGVKNGRERTYQFDEEKNQKLWKKLTRYAAAIESFSTRNNIRPAYLFPSKKRLGLPMTTEAVKRLFKVYAKRAGIPADFSIHSLRHCCGIIRAKRNRSPIKIMLWLRHRSITSTQRYFEQVQFENDSRDAAEEFATYL